jgi:hypothetical protein
LPRYQRLENPPRRALFRLALSARARADADAPSSLATASNSWSGACGPSPFDRRLPGTPFATSSTSVPLWFVTSLAVGPAAASARRKKPTSAMAADAASPPFSNTRNTAASTIVPALCARPRRAASAGVAATMSSRSSFGRSFAKSWLERARATSVDISPVDRAKPCRSYTALATAELRSLSPKNARRSAVSPSRSWSETPGPKSASRGRMRARGTSRRARCHVRKPGGNACSWVSPGASAGPMARGVATRRRAREFASAALSAARV